MKNDQTIIIDTTDLPRITNHNMLHVVWNGEASNVVVGKLVDKLICLNNRGCFDGLELHIDIKEPTQETTK